LISSSPITPASFPESIWSLGDLRLELRMPAAEVLARLAAVPRPVLLMRIFGRQRDFAQVASGSSFKLWQSTYWVKGPVAGSLMLDGHVEDLGGYSAIVGRFRFGWPFCIQLIWIAVILVVAVMVHRPVFATFVTVAILLQAALYRITAVRGRDRLMAKLDDLLAAP
jgi:hypothetical protein